jgi:hypothetical protein
MIYKNKEGDYTKMKITRIILMIVLLASVCAPLAVSAVSYPPAPLYHHPQKAETILTSGAIVYLFHSGTDEINSAIHANDILTVYRINTSCEVREVGKIRVISHIGETYLKCEVMEGEITPNDIAKKGNVAFLVISAGTCNH